MKRPRPVLFVPVLLCLLTAVASAQPEPISWPRQLDTEKGSIVIYQPELESLSGDVLESRAALSYTEKGKSPVFGAIWTRSRLSTDLEARIVALESIEVTDAKFPEVDDPERIDQLKRFLEQEIPKWDLEMSLDQLVASMEDVTKARADIGFNDSPPEVIYSDRPTVLVLIDGKPILEEVEGLALKYVVNSAFTLVQDTRSGKYYLRGGAYWFTSSKLPGDAWPVTSDLPEDVRKVSKKIDEDLAKQAKDDPDFEAPEQPMDEAGKPIVPTVLVRIEPAELIQTSGEPAYKPIEGTNLLYVENTESDILMDISTQKYYVLLAGRWYQSSSLTDNKWKFIDFDDLPADFASIPEGSDMETVLGSVPGTTASKDAILENTIPQTAEIDRKTATFEVTYDGDPEFETCGDAGAAYAKNTDKAVFLINSTYWACEDAVWFTGKGPEGPWTVATEVPKEIQDLPPECPHYNVKYVYIYESTPEVVYVGYTPAYMGSYYYRGSVVWGTGWYYHPWYHTAYYPRPVTYGFGVHYNPWTGWGFSVGVSYGWMHFGYSSWRPPYHGCWGAAGYHAGYRHGYHNGYHHGYNQGAKAGFAAGYRAGQRPKNVYKDRGNGVRRTGTPATRPTAQNRAGTGKTGSAARPGASNRAGTSAKKQPKAAPGKKNNVYSDRDGKVHRQTQDGGWQSRDKGGWSSQNKSSSNQSLNRSSQQRSRGTQKQSRSGSRSRGGGRRH